MSALIRLASLIALSWLILCQASSEVSAAAMDDYQRSFDAYRQAYSSYQVNQADFIKSQTFASEEALTNSAREMLLLRADSWSNYWKTVAGRFETVTSADQKNINLWQAFFKDEVSWLNHHKQELNNQKTRKGLWTEANQLNDRNQIYLSRAFEINVEIISGKIKDVIIQMRGLNQVLLDKLKNQKVDPAKQDVAVRGLESNLERLDRLDEDLKIIKEDFMGESGFADEEQFASITQDFLPLYQQLSQIMLNTRELSKDIQW